MALNITLINYKQKKFYISESPNNNNIVLFLQQISKNNIKHIVRLCKPYYDSQYIINENINFYDWYIDDGLLPSNDIINKWLQLINSTSEPILVHCSAGLGRAPTLVALALINNKMDAYDTIDYIRSKRIGSFNVTQIDFLLNKNQTKNTKCCFFKLFY